MARITIEDCLEKCSNRFELVVAAAQRARELSSGADLTVPWERDKKSVLALREIAEGTVEAEQLLMQAATKRYKHAQRIAGEATSAPPPSTLDAVDEADEDGRAFIKPRAASLPDEDGHADLSDDEEEPYKPRAISLPIEDDDDIPEGLDGASSSEARWEEQPASP